MTAPDMIVLDPIDNVATAMRDLDGPAMVSIAKPDGTRFDLEITGPIKLGHKVAIIEIPQDTPAIKHGEPFGLATAAIAPGAVVTLRPSAMGGNQLVVHAASVHDTTVNSDTLAIAVSDATECHPLG